MKSVNDMITRMNARLEKIEHDQTEHPGWLTRLMLKDARAIKGREPSNSEMWRELDQRHTSDVRDISSD